jgi:hypothetical protein
MNRSNSIKNLNAWIYMLGEWAINKNNTKMMKQQGTPLHTIYILPMFYCYIDKHVPLQTLNHHHQIG